MSIGRITQRVVQQVGDELAQMILVGRDIHGLGENAHARRFSPGDALDHILRQNVQSHLAELVSIGLTDLREQEQVTNQTRHSGNLLACFGHDFDTVLP